jgi:hypothetical protein
VGKIGLLAPEKNLASRDIFGKIRSLLPGKIRSLLPGKIRSLLPGKIRSRASGKIRSLRLDFANAIRPLVKFLAPFFSILEQDKNGIDKS